LGQSRPEASFVEDFVSRNVVLHLLCNGVKGSRRMTPQELRGAD
jgi:hypothetical protein